MNGKGPLDALESGVLKALTAASEDFVNYFEEQRKHYGHHCLGGLRLVSKHSHRVFRNLGRGSLIEAQTEFCYCEARYSELLEHLKIIPQLVGVEIENNAGQELHEARLGIDFYPVQIGEKDISDVRLRTCDELKITPQAWLAGLADYSSEASKLAEHINGRLIRRGKLAITSSKLFDNTLAIVDGIQKYFDRYDGSYPKILNASNRRFQDFHSKERLVGNAGLWTIKALNATEENLESKPLRDYEK